MRANDRLLHASQYPHQLGCCADQQADLAFTPFETIDGEVDFSGNVSGMFQEAVAAQEAPDAPEEPQKAEQQDLRILTAGVSLPHPGVQLDAASA